MNPVVIVVSIVVACLFGGAMAEDPVPVLFAGSDSSTGSTGALFGCKPRSTSSLSGPLVRFQAVRVGGVEYSRVVVPSERMTFGDVVKTDLGSLIFSGCANAAKEKKFDVFSFVNGQCVGYKIGDGICPCTTGDFVLYRASTAIRTPSSARGTIRGSPLPAGYIRKIIYPSVSLTGSNFYSSSSSCEAVLNDTSIMSSLLLLHTADGRCYYADLFSSYPCDSCAGPATEVIVKKDFGNQTFILSNCGGTISAPVVPFAEIEFSFMTKLKILYPHEGYGCIPYPDPALDDNCDITLLFPGATYAILLSSSLVYDLDESAGTTCDGDELYMCLGPAGGCPCKKKSGMDTGLGGTVNNMTIRFQRKPAHNPNSVNKGFFVAAIGFN